MLWVARHAREESSNLIVRLVANSAQQRCSRELALSVNLDVELILPARLKLKPCATVWNDLRRPEGATRYWINRVGVEDARRAHELRNNNALSTIDNERSLARHPWEVAHVDLLAANLARLKNLQLRGDHQWSRVRCILCARILFADLRILELVIKEGELKSLPGEVADRADLLKQFCEEGLGPLRQRCRARDPLRADKGGE